ncbi:nuclear transport factor 2 family protein [Sphingobium phenoxybenzoativorans]|uniref:nuclear transport factor 2 family protein n=1 Tax=Sphingobium phenoxybenzoativorans TaxID=1592790 RepID=UPI0008721151|nr:nuclear transport factor 2 family protein [Sphingobium phenoxybenzoativorans]
MDAERYAAIKASVENLYALTGSGQWDAVEAQLTDDFRIVEADSLPFGGVYEGKDALQRLYTKVFSFWEDPSLDVKDMTVSENNVVVLLSVHATSRYNGERLEMPLCEVMHLRDGKFSGITPYYFDTVAIARATGALTEA